MRRLISSRLDARLIVAVGLGLLIFSVIAGIFSYRYAYRQQLDLAQSLETQLVGTVQVQAEVAAFAINTEIANGVLAGLVGNPIILAARIESGTNFKVELGKQLDVDFSLARAYPLFSPVDHMEPIGRLHLVQDKDVVTRSATEAAIVQTGLMLSEVLIGVLVLSLVLRIVIINPIARLTAELVSIQPGSSTRLDIDPRHAHDEIGRLSRSANVLLDAAETALNEVKDQRNEMERRANHDQLTGLPTIGLAEERLHQACCHARNARAKVALLFIDLDGFKAINDSHGHDIGDEVLKTIALRLRENIRPEDVAARIGGDEFVVILGNLSDADISIRVAGSLNRALGEPMFVSDRSLRLGASIGIAIFPDHTGDIEAMRRVADHAMYRAKKSGKGGYALGKAEVQVSPGEKLPAQQSSLADAGGRAEPPISTS